MAESNSHWGEVVRRDPEMAEVWDRFQPLPEPGEHALLDALCTQKRITIAALVKVGARLAGAGVVAFAGPGYIKYRQLDSGRKWSYIGSEFPQLKLIRAAAQPSDTVIVCEGETDAARLTLLYPDCDVASLPNGVDCVYPEYGKQLAPYQRVVIATDSDEGGERGADRIRKLRPDALRMPPPTKDWCELDGDAPPLPEPEDDGTEVIGGIVFEALDLEETEPDPDILVDDLLYGAGVHLLSGHPGGGKTTVAMHLAIDAMTAGTHVAWLDYETNKRQAKRRLEDCGCSPALAAERFHYARFPLAAEQHLAEIAQRWPNVMVVVDSMSKALASAGINEDIPSEVTQWTTRVVQAVKALDLPFVVIDHVAKNARDTRYSRGAGSKLADVDVHLRVETNEPFNRERKGALTLHLEKDRDGFLPFQTWWEIGDGAGRLPLQRLDSPPGDGDAAPV